MNLEKQELKRYNRQIILSALGPAGQQKLKAARVLVIGAGGLGCPLLLYLAGAGLGYIGIVDDDVVDESNLHRQVLYSVPDIGQPKAEVAAARLRSLNPLITVKPYPTRLELENAIELFQAYDLIIDGSDNFETRYLVNDACVQLNKPFVFGSIFGFEGQLSVFNYRGGPTYRCVFPEPGTAPNCSVNGVLGVLPGIVGTYMANEALKLILEIGESLSGRLMLINILENSFQFFKVSRTGGTPAKSTELPVNEEPETGRLGKDELVRLLETQPEEIFLVDVREPHEVEADDQGGLNIPLSELGEAIEQFPSDKWIVFYCQSGIRSKTAFEILKQSGFKGRVDWV